MKKIFFLSILLIVISCSSINTNTVSQVETVRINTEITEVVNDLKDAAELNKYEIIEEFFLPTFKNKIVINNIKKYNLSNLMFIFSDVIPVSSSKAKGTMVINYGTESNYYDLTWKKTAEGQWKISNVAVKK